MKQTAQKLFRNCPHEDEFLTCKDCPNYTRCRNKKKARKVKKVEHFVNVTLPTVVMIIAIITAIVVIIVCAIISAKEKKKVVATVTTESSLFIGDLVEENTTADSTEHTYLNSIEENLPEEKPSADEFSQEYCYNISESDKILIAKLVWAEARGESFEGKVAVAAVVLNRYYYGNDRDFNRESIEAVITQPKQFATIQNVTMEELDKVPECMEAVEAACKGLDPTREVFLQGALYFFAHDKVSGYQKEIRQGLKVMVIENHTFHFDFEKVR